jgi:hypothetical protein
MLASPCPKSAFATCSHDIPTQVSLGGGGGFEGFYGSVTAGGVSKVYAAMEEHCGFASSSFLVDIGGGLGRCSPLPVLKKRDLFSIDNVVLDSMRVNRARTRASLHDGGAFKGQIIASIAD